MFGEEEQFDFNFGEQAPPPLTYGEKISGFAKASLFFTGGLVWSLASRSFPALMPVFHLSLAGGLIAGILTLFLGTGDRRKMIIVFGGLILGGIVGGTWDGVTAWFLDVTNQYQGLQVVLILAGVFVAMLVDRVWRKGDDQ